MNRTAQRIREIVLSRLSVYIRVCADKNDEPWRTHAKKYLNSTCLQIHTEHVTFLFAKRFLRKECKEYSIVRITALVIIDKIALVVIDAIECLTMVKNFIEYIVH